MQKTTVDESTIHALILIVNQTVHTVVLFAVRSMPPSSEDTEKHDKGNQNKDHVVLDISIQSHDRELSVSSR